MNKKNFINSTMHNQTAIVISKQLSPKGMANFNKLLKFLKIIYMYILY
jgi:hypothetical protein